MKFLIFLFLFFFGFTVASKEIKIPVGQTQSILVKGIYLKLKVKKSISDQYQIKWTGPLSVKNEGSVLSIQDKSFNSRKSWKSSSKKALATLEITGPATPIKVFALDIKASFLSWEKSVFISGFKGSLEGSRNKGIWKIHFQEGRLNLRQQKGSLFVRGFFIKNRLRSSQGDFQFLINEGSLNVSNSEGHLRFVTDKAKAVLKNLKGSLIGSSQSGDLKVSIKPKKVDFFVEEASIRLSLMGQAPKIKAYTEKGKIYGSNYLHKQFSGKSMTVSGRIRGSSKKGEVFVHSNTGNIYIN